MAFKPIGKKPVGIQSSPWVIMATAMILFIVVVVLAVQNISREKRHMSQILLEKGVVLISAVEAGARTGMMHMAWRGDQVQQLLEETAQLPGVLFLAITDQNGLILADSDKSKIGRKISSSFSPGNLTPEAQTRWRLTINDNKQQIFEVYQFFKPLAYTNRQIQNSMTLMKRRGMMRGPGKDWCFPENPSENRQVIFVGLNMKPFEDARKEDIRNTIIISTTLLLLGLGGFLFVTYAQAFRATRRSLRDTSAFADEVVTNIPVGLIATDRNEKIAFLNPAAEKITGIELKDVLGKNSDKILPDHWCGLKERLMEGQPILEQEMECVFSDQRMVPLSVSATKIVNEENEFVGNILILRDLGEVRRLQEEVRRKEKLAALGRLAGGVAHEIRNPLSSIKGLATYFGNKFSKESEDREAADVMVREVNRLNRVVSELLELARPSELKLKQKDINELLAHSARLVQQDARAKHIEIQISGTDGLPLIPMDPDRISQCLLNLYLNAIQAMDEGGILSIKSLPDHDEHIKIEIADTGKGISINDLKNIFEPYFTTKASGTGLGLAIVHKIIEAHQGEIKVESTIGKGTVFSIFLPTRPKGRN